MAKDTADQFEELTTDQIEELARIEQRISLRKEWSEQIKTPLAVEDIGSSEPVECAATKVLAGPTRMPNLLKRVETSQPVMSTAMAERTSGMTTDKRINEEDPTTEELSGWAPELIDDGDGPYYLFTWRAHRDWMARAEELVSRWEREGDNADREVCRALWVLMHIHTEGFDEDGSEIGNGDLHLEEHAEAREVERWDMSFDKINPILRAEELIARLPESSGRLQDAWLRHDALRYLEIKFNSSDPEEREERHNLGLSLGLEDPDAPTPF